MEVDVEKGELGEGEADEKLLRREGEGVGEAVTDETGEEERRPRGSSARRTSADGDGDGKGGSEGGRGGGAVIGLGEANEAELEAWRPKIVRREGRGEGVLG